MKFFSNNTLKHDICTHPLIHRLESMEYGQNHLDSRFDPPKGAPTIWRNFQQFVLVQWGSMKESDRVIQYIPNPLDMIYNRPAGGLLQHLHGASLKPFH